MKFCYILSRVFLWKFHWNKIFILWNTSVGWWIFGMDLWKPFMWILGIWIVLTTDFLMISLKKKGETCSKWITFCELVKAVYVCRSNFAVGATNFGFEAHKFQIIFGTKRFVSPKTVVDLWHCTLKEMYESNFGGI